MESGDRLTRIEFNAVPNEQPDDHPSLTNDVRDSHVAMVLSSQPLGWSRVAVEQLTYATTQIEWAPQADHVLTVHIAEPMSLVRQRDGQTHRGGLVTGGFTLTPASNPSIWYWDNFLDKLHMRLTPDFVRKVAADCDLNPDRIELLHHFGTHDPQIERLGLALASFFWYEHHGAARRELHNPPTIADTLRGFLQDIHRASGIYRKYFATAAPSQTFERFPDFVRGLPDLVAQKTSSF